MATSNPSHESQQHPAPFAVMRRRTVMACSNCRKRKIKVGINRLKSMPSPEHISQCKTMEQPSKNPCARCAKKGLTCEYVAAPEPAYYSMSRPQTPERPVQDLPDAGLSTPQMRWTPPTTPPNFSQGRGGAPLPYTGPPPSNELLTACAHSDPSRPGSRYPLLPPRSSNPTFAACDQGSVNVEPTRPFVHPQYYPPARSGSNQAYMHPQYAPGQFIPQYDLQAAHARQYLATHAP
ncbi:hypothetical protein DFH09DRAFT_1408832 [Mycena vulgaris]|nr:hypothetical protein DFH09DRAFT_1408832 [Mycena vulgaris]